ncbi:MAG: hypothetical protein ABL994_14375 [Verrucomicrobiales bacterium]
MNLLRRRDWAKLYVERLRSRGIVLGGPFKGMHYVSESVGSQFWPKLFGTYECELHELFAQFDRENFKTVVDVGAAEGYYAVGCAVRWPNTTVVAFETEPRGRDLLAKMAERNGVADRVRIRGHADPDALGVVFGADLKGAVLCIMDVEGGEDVLCDPGVIPALTRAHILVETHEFAVPGIEDRLVARFASTHRCKGIVPRPRSVSDFSESVPLIGRLLFGRNLPQVVDEWRTPNCGWLYLAPLHTK